MTFKLPTETNYLLSMLILIKLVKSKPLQAMSYLLVARVGPCQDRRSTELVYVSEMSLYKQMYDSSLSGVIYISEDIEDGWNLKATMQKCSDIRNLDTCDFYKSFAMLRGGCNHTDQVDVYDMFFQYLTPKMHCPIKAGNYTIKDFPFFTEDSDLTAAESIISTSVFGYTYRVEAFNNDEERIMCLDSHLRLNYIRKHDWVGNKKIGARVGTPPTDNDTDDD